MAELNPSQLKIFITEVNEAIGTEVVPVLQRLASTAFILLAESDPASALAFFSGHFEVMKPVIWTMLPLSTAVSGLADQDPVAALEWVRQNSSGRSGIVFNDAKISLVRHLAPHSPAMAFEAFREFGLPNDAHTLLQLFLGRIDSTNREAMLAEFRKHIRSQDEEAQAALSTAVLSRLSHRLSEKPFVASAGWLETLSPPEAEAFVQGLSQDRLQETGGWIGWLADAPLSQTKREQVVRDLFDRWIRHDALAAGNWLVQAPEDAAKAPAVRAYIEAITPLEPRIAAQWALTLPPGEERQATLRQVHHRWPAGDTEGKAAFAKEHGIRSD